MPAMIPAFDLRPAVDEIEEELVERWRRLLAETAFVGGDEVARFEDAFADYLGAAGCVGVANGTDALELALRTLGIGGGDENDRLDEVIVPAFTFVATATAVVLAGARPVLVDVDEETLNLDPSAVERAIGPQTRGVVAVHLYGQPADLDALTALCERRGLRLIEDAAQAHGARWNGRPVGTFGELATWSFYPSKNLGCFGDGGAVTGMDTDLLATAQRLGDHGRMAHYRHGVVGRNSRLDALQAAVLNLRLPRLDRANDRRRAIAGRYREALDGVGDLRFVAVPDAAEPVYHQVTVRSGRRDDLRQHLSERGVGTAVHYPLPLHRQPALVETARSAGSLAVAERAAEEVLCLPIFPALGDDAVERVIAAVRGFFA